MLKQRYVLLENFASKSEVVSHTITNVDVFTLTDDDTRAYINYMHVTNGAINQAFTYEFKKKLDETEDDILTLGIIQIREQVNSDATEIIVPFEPETPIPGVTITVPQRGDKKHLLEIALKNATQHRDERLRMMEKLNPEQRTTRTLTTMQRDLRMNVLPRHVECFDNSNIGGTSAVASCVVFRNAKPAKKEYRHFNIKTVEGADDFATMREVVNRRYSRLVQEGQELPQLLIVDGGKGQVNAALEALEVIGLRGQMTVVGIAKRLNEVYFPGDSVPLYIDKNSETLHVIQRLRDEAHRFAITFHRKQRSKSQVQSALDDIPGIGPKTRTLLLKHFKSLKRIREATPQELEALIGPAKANALLTALQEQQPAPKGL